MRHVFSAILLVCLMYGQTAVAGRVAPRGGDSRYVWGGSYSFQFRVTPESKEKAVKVFFYGFPTAEGRWSYNGFELDRGKGSLKALTYSQYGHRHVETCLENVLAVGDSNWKGSHRIAPLKDDSGAEYVLEDGKVYNVRVQAKDKMHTVNLFLDNKRVATATYDASMRYAGAKPKFFKTITNEVFAVKKDDTVGELKERGYLKNKPAAPSTPTSAPSSGEAGDMTELMTAIQDGLDKAIGPILESAPDLDIQDTNGDTALMYAIRKGNFKLVAELVNRGASVEMANDAGQTPLHLAASKNDEKLCRYLIKKGAKKHADDKTGKKPYAYATDKGLKEFLIMP